jgi:hypothetical protein
MATRSIHCWPQPKPSEPEPEASQKNDLSSPSRVYQLRRPQIAHLQAHLDRASGGDRDRHDAAYNLKAGPLKNKYIYSILVLFVIACYTVAFTFPPTHWQTLEHNAMAIGIFRRWAIMDPNKNCWSNATDRTKHHLHYNNI